jgi:DNA-binding MarR family transcriptional regulator
LYQASKGAALSDTDGTALENDPTAVIARELVALVRSLKELHGLVVPTGGPTVERPAFLILMRVFDAGPLRPSALADTLCVDLSTVSRQLVTLEARGWVERLPDEVDRRAHLVRVTEEGRRVLDRNVEARLDLVAGFLADWPEPARTSFAAQLTSFNQSVNTHAAQFRRQVATAPAGTRQEN